MTPSQHQRNQSEKKISNQRNTSSDTFRIESSNSQSIKRDRKKSRKFFVKINFVIDSDFCFFMNHANESIDDHFNRSIDDSNCFLIENSFHSFPFIDSKQKKINDLLKKKFSNSSTNAICYQTFVFSTHVS